MSAFVGGGSLEAAEFIARDTLGTAEFVLPGVASLVDKSLLRATPVEDVPRYAMLETIREFGLAQLVEAGEEEAIRAAHAAWCASYAERWEAEVKGPNQVVWIPWSEAEIDNIRAALAWLRERGDTTSAMRLVSGLGWYWQYPGRYHEGLAHIESVLAMPGADVDPALHTSLLLNAGSIANWLGDSRIGLHYYKWAEHLARESGDDRTLALSLGGLGSVAFEEGKFDRAGALFAECRERCRESGEPWHATWATAKLGGIAFAQGDLQAALALYSEALAEWRAAGDLGHVMSTLDVYGLVLLRLGNRESARTAFAEMLDLAQEDDPWCSALATRGLAAVAEADGDYRAAARLLAATNQWLDREGTRHYEPVEAVYRGIEDRIEERLGAADYVVERNAGVAWSKDEVVAQAKAGSGWPRSSYARDFSGASWPMRLA